MDHDVSSQTPREDTNHTGAARARASERASELVSPHLQGVAREPGELPSSKVDNKWK